MNLCISFLGNVVFFNFQRLWMQCYSRGLNYCSGSLLQRRAHRFSVFIAYARFLGGCFHSHKTKEYQMFGCHSWDLVWFLRSIYLLSGLGPLSTIHLNSSTIFLMNKLHRYVWLFRNVIVYLSSLINFMKIRSFLDTIIAIY